MSSIQRFSETVIDYAERLSNVADAAAGKRATKGKNGGPVTTTRWVFLPAAGAGLYALVRSDFFARQAKEVMGEAKARASDLPTDLMNAVRETSQKPTSQKPTQQRSTTSQRSTTQKSKTRSAGQRSSSQRSGAQRRRQTASGRNSKSG